MAGEGSRAVDRFVQVGDLKLHYLEWGDPGSETVVMIHGLTGNAHAFDRLAPHFAPLYRVLAVDVRGRGDSEWARDADYTNEAYVRDLEGLRAALRLERISLIGTSMGGRISMAYSAAYPQRVERVVINDIGPELDPRGLTRIRSYVGEAPQRFQGLAEVVAWYREHYPQYGAMSDQELTRAVGYAVKPHPEGGLAWKMDPAVRNPVRPPAPPTEDPWTQVKKITAPVLVIRGGESDLLSPEVAQRMVREMQQCRLVVVPGVGHAPLLTEPEALGAIKEMFGLP